LLIRPRKPKQELPNDDRHNPSLSLDHAVFNSSISTQAVFSLAFKLRQNSLMQKEKYIRVLLTEMA